jgi:hypothetical protein
MSSIAALRTTAPKSTLGGLSGTLPATSPVEKDQQKQS